MVVTVVTRGVVIDVTLHAFQLCSRHEATNIASVLPFYPPTRQEDYVLIACTSKCMHLYGEIIITSHMHTAAVTGINWTDGIHWSRRGQVVFAFNEKTRVFCAVVITSPINEQRGSR